MSPALNAAAQPATGDVLVFTDADVLLESGALRYVAETFADREVGGDASRKVAAGRSRLFMIPYYLCLVNRAALLALLSVLRGDRTVGGSPRGGFSLDPT